MKRIWILLLILVLVFVTMSPILADQDPVVSLDYLNEVLRPEMMASFETLANGRLQAAQLEDFSHLTELIAAHNLSAQQTQSSPRKAKGAVTFKKGDVLTLSHGTQISVLTGTITTGTNQLVNVTDGVVAPQNKALAPQTRYMMGDGKGKLTVNTETCEVMLSGLYTLAPSDAVDYGSMAQALQTMGLFQGMGNGFGLEIGATRAQGLVMFLRILGLEDEALAHKGNAPFSDVPKSHWVYPYVAYAFEEGLTAGISATKFAPESPITAQHYVTFLLRALEYDEGTAFTYQTALVSAITLKLFTKGEMDTFSQGIFRRSHMVYLSYYSLYGINQVDNVVLMTKLVDNRTIKSDHLYDGICNVRGARIS